jgi:hypothetical protein
MNLERRKHYGNTNKGIENTNEQRNLFERIKTDN